VPAAADEPDPDCDEVPIEVTDHPADRRDERLARLAAEFGISTADSDGAAQVQARITAVRDAELDRFAAAQRRARRPGTATRLRTAEVSITTPADGGGINLTDGDLGIDEPAYYDEDEHFSAVMDAIGGDSFVAAGDGWLFLLPAGEDVRVQVRLELWSGEPPAIERTGDLAVRELAFRAWGTQLTLNDGFDFSPSTGLDIGLPGRYRVRVVVRGRDASHTTHQEEWTLQFWPDL
jgi:hypothetical protein